MENTCFGWTTVTKLDWREEIKSEFSRNYSPGGTVLFLFLVSQLKNDKILRCFETAAANLPKNL